MTNAPGLASATRSSRFRKRLALSSMVAAAALVWPLAHAGTALVVSHRLEAPDAIVILASHEWERLPAAAALARQHVGALVLLTLPQVVTDNNCHRCSDRPAWLEVEGIDRSRIKLLPRRATNTYEEAEAARHYALDRGIMKLLIVTSPYHTRRAWGTFNTVFEGTLISLGIEPAVGARGNAARWWSSSYDRAYVGYEWAARVKYRIVYGVTF